MLRFTLIKKLVAMYNEETKFTVLATGQVVEIPAGAVPFMGIIQVRHKGRLVAFLY
jgi:hypothetical protein